MSKSHDSEKNEEKFGNMNKQLGRALCSVKVPTLLLDAIPAIHEETGPSEANLFSSRCIIDLKQSSTKQVKPIARLHKTLKFRLALEADIKDLPADNTNVTVND